MLILTPQEIKKAENKANEAGLSYETMMENAGKGCADYISEHHKDIESAVILCGKGKNGGDGFVIGRYLAAEGIKVSIVLVFNSPSDPLSEKNKSRLPECVRIINYEENPSGALKIVGNADIIIDAVFGIGFKGTLPEQAAELFRTANMSEAVKTAIDIPSGLSEKSNDTENCFHADETLSMLCYKREHIYKPYRDFCGKITVIPIGFSVNSKNTACALTENDIKNLLIKRNCISNKGTFGKALIAAGCFRMPGAAVIAAAGCAHTGAGLTCLAFPDRCYPAVTPQIKECVLFPLESNNAGEFSIDNRKFFAENCEKYDAIAAGCGMGTGDGAAEIIKTLIKTYTKTLIIDADGINIISKNINILKDTKADIILTPHPGEMSRLTGRSIEEINSRRIETAKGFARKYKVTLLLKGSGTVIASKDGRCIINPTGSSALARGGSGDLLTGIIASFAAQGMNAFDAAAAAAYIHGLAGEKAGKKYTEYASCCDSIISEIPDALSSIIKSK